MDAMIARINAGLTGRYVVEREIGRGGMATVYLAQDLRHHRKVALKMLKPEVTLSMGAERFLKEIEIAAGLTHPNILPVHDSGEVDGMLFYVMPYVEGESLRERLGREGKLPLEEAIRVATEAADALDYAHRQGIVHRDVKPANILMVDGHAVIADFGVARAVSAAGHRALTGMGIAIGTPAYMSPEQAMAVGDVDGRSDIYSLGRTLYEMLVGDLTMSQAEQRAIASGKVSAMPPEHREELQHVPQAVIRTVARATAQDPDDRFQTAQAFGESLVSVSGRRRMTRTGRLVAVTGVVVAAAVMTLLVMPRGPPGLDEHVLAIAPFGILDTDLALWREGLVDVLAGRLDGAGPLRTVPPSVVMRQWEGPADQATATALGASTGAGLALYGQIVSAGPDSARALATLIDVRTRRPIAEFDVRDDADRLDKLADSLAVHIIAELSRTRDLSGSRLASLGSSSPAALKAFLQGEQHYRRFTLDSAAFYFQRAVELDTTFALAYGRLAIADGWSATPNPELNQLRLRAGELNHGLARRESLLVVADSIRAAMVQFSGDSAAWAMYRRLFATLESATTLYPLDPIVWYELGEARYHYGAELNVTDEQTYDAFAQAIALDSTFMPGYRHLFELTLLLQGRDVGREVAAAYLAHSDSNEFRDAARAIDLLLDPSHSDDTRTQQALDSLSSVAIFQVWYDLKWYGDSAATSLRVARAWMDDDTTAARQALALALTYHGKVAEAYRVAANRYPALLVVLARFGAVSPDSMDAAAKGWLDARNSFNFLHAHRWWAERRDTAALQTAVVYWDSVEAELPQLRYRMRDLGLSAQAYLALAQDDTTRALELFAQIPNWPNRYYTYYEQLTRARLLSRLGRNGEAAHLLDHMPFERQFAPTSEAIIVELERGRVHERLGNLGLAIAAYSTVIDAWHRADPVLQPIVDEARAALARIGAEPRR